MAMELMTTTNAYGETKVISAKILKDVAKANPVFSVSLLSGHMKVVKLVKS